MAKKKTLLDLYVVGKEIVFEQGTDSVKVWLQKLSPLDHETAVRKANAARARVLLSTRDPDGDLLKSIENELLDERSTKESLIELLTSTSLVEYAQAREAEFASQSPWSDDNYLQGLHDAWNDGLAMQYATDPEDPEAKTAHDELERFATKVKEAVDAGRTSMAAEYDDKSFQELWDEALKHKVGNHSDLAWLLEFRRCEAWLSVRDPDSHANYYFGDRSDVDRLSPIILRRIIEEYSNLETPVMEGKDLPETS